MVFFLFSSLFSMVAIFLALPYPYDGVCCLSSLQSSLNPGDCMSMFEEICKRIAVPNTQEDSAIYSTG